MSITSDGQMVLVYEEEMFGEEKEAHMSPKESFDFKELFSVPISEEYMCSHNSMAVLGESLSFLRKMKDKSVQLIFADAPYNIGKDFGNDSDKWECVSDYIEWCKTWIDECMRVLSDTGTMYFMTATQHMPYVELLMAKDHALINILEELRNLDDYSEKKAKINALLTEDAEARIFEIISYAILKNHYKNVTVFFGYTKETIDEVALELFKTGRTNANDGGIDFVMRPVGRFFQVTEVNNYDKYLLDIDKVMHFPVSFVIKTSLSKEKVLADLDRYIAQRSSGMTVLEERYKKAIEEIITINELQAWTTELNNNDIDGIIRDIDIYYKLEMNMDAEDEEE